MTRRTRLPGVVAVLIVLLGFTASIPAAAQDDQPPAVLLILDGSGSMNADDDAGRPLIDLAKEALTSIINLLPEAEVEVGLRVYGHRTPNTDQAVGCTDSELVVPVGPLDPGRMTDEINAIRPSGFTPIGLSLTEAAQDLAGFDTATVILVSDGEDTCAPPDPCEVAAELATQGITVNTVGFYLEDGSAARNQLECIADATGGTYRDADEDVDLAGVVGVFLREVPGIGNFHIPFNGSTDRATAPLIPLTPSDDFVALETTIAAGETRWFAVDVPPGYVVSVFGDARRFVEAAIPEPGDALAFTILDPDGRSVGVAGRFGLDRIDLAQVLATDIVYVQTISIETERLVAPYEQFLDEPWMLEGLEYRGFDEESWNAAKRLELRYERRSPHPAGTYLIGVDWQSELDAVTTFDSLVALRRADSRMFVSPASVTGSTDSASPTRLEELPEYNSWGFGDPELDPIRELYAEGPTSPDETRWFSVEVAWEETVLVDALLAVPEGSPLPETDELSIEILDPRGEAVTSPHPGGAPAGGTVGELTRFFGEGFEPRPLVSASARAPGPDSPSPGIYRIGVSWESIAGPPDATLEMRIGVAQPDGMVEMPLAYPETLSTAEGSDTSATDDTVPTTVDADPSAIAPNDEPGSDADDDSTPFVPIAVIGGLMALGAAVAAWSIRRRQQT